MFIKLLIIHEARHLQDMSSVVSTCWSTLQGRQSLSPVPTHQMIGILPSQVAPNPMPNPSLYNYQQPIPISSLYCILVRRGCRRLYNLQIHKYVLQTSRPAIVTTHLKAILTRDCDYRIYLAVSLQSLAFLRSRVLGFYVHPSYEG